MLFIIAPALVILYVFNQQIYMLLIMLLGDEHREYGAISETGAYMMMILIMLCAAFAFFMLSNDQAEEETLGLRHILCVHLQAA